MDYRSEFLRINQQACESLGIAFRNRKLAFLTERGRLKQLRIQTGFLIEEYFFNLCTVLKVNLLIECGAHDATTSMKFTKTQGRSALAFEANPYVYERFKSNINPRLIEYVNIGLASQPGSLQLNIPSHTPKSWSMQSSFSKTIEFSDFEQVTVNVDSLDNLASRKIEVTSTALWIDVEGFGYSVLEGASEILRNKNCKLIFIEVQDRAFWDNEQNALEICKYLSDFDFIPIVRDCPLADLYNIIFVKSPEIGKILTITNRFWFDSTRIRPIFWDARPFRFYLSLLKRFILFLGARRFDATIHRISKFFGSRSSSDSK